MYQEDCMMKKMCFFAVFLLVLFFSSCGAGGKQRPASGPEKIEFWYGLGGRLGEEMESIIKSFNESQSEVHVTGVQQSNYSETARQLQAAIAANQVPAAVMLGTDAVDTFKERGIFELLDTYIKETPDFNREDIPSSLLIPCLNSQNELIALPISGSTPILFYNIKIIKDAGIDPESAFKNYQSLAEAARKLTKRSGGETVVYGFDAIWYQDIWADIVYSNGGLYYSDDKKTATINTPQWIEVFEFLRKCINDEKIFNLNYGGEGWEYWYKNLDDVMQGRAAACMGTAGDLRDIDFSIVAAHLEPGFGDNRMPFISSVMLTLPKIAGKTQKDAGFKWISYVTNASNQSKWALGTGYMPVRTSTAEEPEYKAYVAEHPEFMVPLETAKKGGRRVTYDFTGGKLLMAAADAFDKVMIENVPAAQALAEAQKIAQAAIDEYWAGAGN
jgi:multiple sugar transport system substrate-binding protein